MFRSLRISHVEFRFPGSEKQGPSRNGIFRLFQFSGILGQPREVHPKFRNEIPENVCSIRSTTRIFWNFWSNGKRPWRVLTSGVTSHDFRAGQRTMSGLIVELTGQTFVLPVMLTSQNSVVLKMT